MLQLQLNDQIGMAYDNLIKLSLRHQDLLIVKSDKEASSCSRTSWFDRVWVFSTIHAKSVRGVYEAFDLEWVRRAQDCFTRYLLPTINCRRRCGRFCDGKLPRASASRWNQQMDLLAQSGYIQLAQAQAEKNYLPLNKANHWIVLNLYSVVSSVWDRRFSGRST